MELSWTGSSVKKKETQIILLSDTQTVIQFKLDLFICYKPSKSNTNTFLKFREF